MSLTTEIEVIKKDIADKHEQNRRDIHDLRDALDVIIGKVDSMEKMAARIAVISETVGTMAKYCGIIITAVYSLIQIGYFVLRIIHGPAAAPPLPALGVHP